MKISVVIPIHNEEGNIFSLDKEIREVILRISSDYEIIYVDDGSTDNSLNELKKLKNVKIIELNRNYGQATALDSGFKLASGEIVVSLDGDLQNDPNDIPKMLKKLKDDNLDVVCGWRKFRKDKSSIKVLTKIARIIRNILISDKVHDEGCTLRVYKQKAVKSLDIGGEMHRYIVALLKWKGFKIGEVVVNHRPRVQGKTKYGYSKALKGFIDLIYIWFIDKYSQRPLHIFGYLSFLSILLGLGSLSESVYARINYGLSLNRNGFFFVGLISILAAVMFFSFGIVLDLLIRTHLNTSLNEKRYYIREIIEK